MKQIYRIGVAIFVLLAASACVPDQHRPMMTTERFEEVNIGISEELLVKKYGPPLNIYHRDDGVTVYEYIERFNMGTAENRIVEARRYFFYVKEGKVVSKQMSIKNQPSFEPMNQVPY